MADGVPDKGRVLNQISLFWFDHLKKVAPHHFLTADLGEIGRKHPELNGRSMIVRKTKPLPIGSLTARRPRPPPGSPP